MNYQAFVMLAALTAASCAAATRSPVLADARPALGSPSTPAATRASRVEPLELAVYPRIVTGDYASVRLRIEPDVRSRHVEVSWWSEEGLGGLHRVQVDGDRAAARYEFPIKRIDPGDYDVTAVLTRSDGTRVRRTTTVRVMGRL